jgi:hypothetical protein
MTQQFVNPSPNMNVQGFLFFDFPSSLPSIGVSQAPPAAGSGAYSAVGCFGNVNLRAPVTEALYGPLGNPPLEQGHPFMKESIAEPEDPTVGLGGQVNHDQIVDIDHAFQLDHTGRLSGSFVDAIASKPYFSTVIVSAVAVAPVVAATASIPLAKYTEWLEPRAENRNVWFFRQGTTTSELLFSAHVRIDDPRRAGFIEESVYKLVYQWKFWKYTRTPFPDDPPDPIRNSERLGISGFDEAITFEVIGKTEDLP